MNSMDHARAYVAAQPPAVSGCKGHNNTFRVACYLVRFGLGNTDALALLREFSARCDPPWTEKELRHKLADARKAVRLHRVPAVRESVRLTWKPEWFAAHLWATGFPPYEPPKPPTPPPVARSAPPVAPPTAQPVPLSTEGVQGDIAF